jgi:hypothetical protein
MAPKRLGPIIEIEPATPADVLDGLETLEGRSGQGVILRPPGDGPDRLGDCNGKKVIPFRISVL